MPTKDELEAENEQLRARVEELESTAAAGSDYAPTTVAGAPDGEPTAAPLQPEYGLSEGERLDLEQNGVTVSPFTGKVLTATNEGVTPLNEEARRRDREETARLARMESTDDQAPTASTGTLGA